MPGPAIYNRLHVTCKFNINIDVGKVLFFDFLSIDTRTMKLKIEDRKSPVMSIGLRAPLP